ncbi:MAG TPA: YbaB/EbfC family nucleoid-associated protein [Actinokineospora sp.]|jgi:DNA-binding protein YbaB|nr:YbaB/EbfC family nucleoid-associated protein [Actinokineospora sp.]
MDEAKYQETLRRFEEQAARAASLKESIAQLKGSARNGDGSVTVTVAPSGAVLGLQLSPAAMNRSHTQLTQEILGTIRQAQQQAAAKMEETVRPFVGDAQYERFQAAFKAHSADVEPLGPSTPPPAASLPSPQAAAKPDFGGPVRQPKATRPADEPDDGDFSDESIFRGRR